MYAKSIEKRELILEGAKNVILRKGFSATSMKNVIEECQISRGGLYFYFSSVEEIFMEILKTRKRTTETLVQGFIRQSANFSALLDLYFGYQTERLLHIEKSLLSDMIEFGLSHKAPADLSLIEDQYQGTKEILLEIMDFGAKRGELRGGEKKGAAGRAGALYHRGHEHQGHDRRHTGGEYQQAICAAETAACS